MMIFSKDMEITRSIPTRIASYSASLLDVGKANRIACYILSPIGALSCRSTPALVCREAPSTLRIHQLALPWSASYWGISARKSATTYPFIAKQGSY